MRKFVILRHDFFGSDSKLMELQNVSQLIVDSWFILVLISFCNLLMVDLVLGVIVQPPKPTFLLNEVQDGLTNRRFGVIATVHFRCGCIDCLLEFVT